MPENSQLITVVKLDHNGKRVTSYQGRIMQRDDYSVVLQARWERGRMELGYVTFEPEDRLVEFFFTNRWYSIFEIHAGSDDRLKGWYCNISRPAVFSDDSLSAIDLELDLFVHPDGRIEILDQDEFDALNLRQKDPAAWQEARDAVKQLRAMVDAHRPPFEALAGASRI